MKVTIEIESDDDLRRLREVFGEGRIEVRRSGERAAASDRKQRRENVRRALSRFRGKLPPGYTFDRDEIHDRHG